jgi:hypothetical protein
MMPDYSFFSPDSAISKTSPSLSDKQKGKVYADVPLSYFANLDELKQYVLDLKYLGVNVLLILPHFLPSLSPYVVKSYEKPCKLFSNWENFAAFMKFVADQGMDRMIDIPFNHADWEAENLKREWFCEHENQGIEAGADDVDADNNRIHVNWGAYVLDNSNPELQNYWLEKVIFPHIEKYNVNAIRIDAAWGLDSEGLTRIIKETKKRFPQVWFLAENLGMAPLIKLAKSGIQAGADRFFNNLYWYNGGLYIPADIYKLYKRSNKVPTCTIFSSHDTLMPAMKALAKARADQIKGLNDKAIVRKFVQYENIHSLADISTKEFKIVSTYMKTDFALSALFSSDLMFVAGSEKALFERTDVLQSNPESFRKGIDSDFPQFAQKIIRIKFSHSVFNVEGITIPFGSWEQNKTGIKGFVKTCSNGDQCLVCANTDLKEFKKFIIPNRIKDAVRFKFHTDNSIFESDQINSEIELAPSQLVILTCERKQK